MQKEIVFMTSGISNLGSESQSKLLVNRLSISIVADGCSLSLPVSVTVTARGWPQKLLFHQGGLAYLSTSLSRGFTEIL